MPSKQRYPSDVENAFLSNCDRTSNGKQAYCECALAHIERTTSYNDFEQNAIAVEQGRAKIAPSETAAEQACASLIK